MAPLLGMGYYLTSVLLSEAMMLEIVNLAGAVCGNDKFLPSEGKQKLSKWDSVASHKNRLPSILGWQDKSMLF